MRRWLLVAILAIAVLGTANAQIISGGGGGGGSGSTTIPNQASLRVVTAAGAVTATTSDSIIDINKASGAATTVNMPACNANSGLTLIIVDGKGDAALNNITLTPSAGNINGATTFVMNINRQSETIWYDGSQCVVSP